MPLPRYYHDGRIDISILAPLFEKAETAIKRVEHETSNLTIPAVNQLRYAGHHLIRSLNDKSKNDELRKAANHCKRALFDAYEAGILYDLILFKKFKEDYNKSVVSNVISDWVEVQQRVDELKEFNIKYRKADLDDTSIHDPDEDDFDDNPRVQNFEECENYFLEMQGITTRLDYARDDLNNSIKKEQMHLRIAVVAIIITILLAFLGLGLDIGGEQKAAASLTETPPQIEQKANP